MLQVDSGFEKLLGAHSGDDLDAEGGSVIGLWPDGRIALVNDAWGRFAAENDGGAVTQRWPLGSELLSGISGVLREYYSRAFERVRATRMPWEQTYQCHAPNVPREFRLRVLPLQERALLLVHSPVVDFQGIPLEAPPSNDVVSSYIGPGGMVRQCSNCRRTQRRGSGEAWDWVRAYVSHPPGNVTHGICRTCIRHYYPDL